MHAVAGRACSILGVDFSPKILMPLGSRVGLKQAMSALLRGSPRRSANAKGTLRAPLGGSARFGASMGKYIVNKEQ